MNDDIIKNDQCVKDFLRMRSLRESTKYAYILRIKSFANFVEKTPTMLIEEAELEDDQEIRPRKRKLNKYLLDYMDCLENSNKSRNTIKNNVETIKAFFNYFDISTPKIKLKNKNENKVFESIPEIKHVRLVLKYANIRDKAIILLMLTSGMGLSEVKHLNFGDFLNAMEEYLDLDSENLLNIEKISKSLYKEDCSIGTWKITRRKTGMPYITFNSPESTNAIVDYLIYREKNNKLIKTLDDPLFVDNRNHRMYKSTYIQLFQRLNTQAGFDGNSNKQRRFFTSHKLRKLFTTTLYNNGEIK